MTECSPLVIPPLPSHFSAAFEADSGRKEYQEELYECQFRVPFTSFDRAESCWRDAVSEGGGIACLSHASLAECEELGIMKSCSCRIKLIVIVIL